MVKAVINAAAIPARYTRDMVFTPWFSGDGAGLPQLRPASDYSGIRRSTVRGARARLPRWRYWWQRRPVLDDEWLAAPLRQPLPYQSRDDVGRAGRPKGHDHARRPRKWPLRATSKACSVKVRLSALR